MRPGGLQMSLFGAPVLTYFKYAPLRCSHIVIFAAPGPILT